jgi:hypothetical protein
MNDEALRAVWTSNRPADRRTLMTTVKAVLDEDCVAREKDRRVRRAALIAVTLLCPALLWFAAYGRTPLVRAGYALMAVGTTVVLVAEWMYLSWAQQCLPGPLDARAQLQRTALLLSYQANLFRTAPLWCAPVFVGAALVGAWVYQQRSPGGGFLLWASIGAAWVVSAITGLAKGKKLHERRSQIERLLSDLG